MQDQYILYNGKIFTDILRGDYEEALLVTGDTIGCVGTLQLCREAAASGAEEIDLEGKHVLPAFLDGHTHPILVARSNWHVIMPAEKDKEKLLQNIKEAAEAVPKEEMPYFFADAYYSETFGEQGPDRKLLDQLIPDRPACICEYTEHAWWYNTKALQLLGIKKEGTDPLLEEGAFIVRDAKTGEPTGWIKERSAHFDAPIFDAVQWYPPDGVDEDHVTPFLDFMRENGVCAMLDASCESEAAFRLFSEMDQAGRLNMYYEGAHPLFPLDDPQEVIAEICRWEAAYATKHVHIRTLKLYFDGTNELGTGACLEPPLDAQGGMRFDEPAWSAQELTEVMGLCNEAGVDIHMHVVGDRGFRICCDAVEEARHQCKGDWIMRVTLAHCELVDPADAARAAALGIGICTTPHDAGGYYGEMAVQHLGRARWERMYDYTDLLRFGAIVGHSSDVTSYLELTRARPLFGISVASGRIDMEQPLDPARFADGVRPPVRACLPRPQLLCGFTENNAHIMRLSDKLGTLAAGKKACLLIMDEDFLERSPQALAQTVPSGVIFDGRPVADWTVQEHDHAE